MNRAPAINDAKIAISSLDWCVRHYTPGIEQQHILSEQILSKSTTELRYVRRFIFIKGAIYQNYWTFELGTQERVNMPIWIISGFQQKKADLTESNQRHFL